MKTVEIPTDEEFEIVIEHHKYTVKLHTLDLTDKGYPDRFPVGSKEDLLPYDAWLNLIRETTLILTFDVQHGSIPNNDNTIEGKVTKVDGKALLE